MCGIHGIISTNTVNDVLLNEYSNRVSTMLKKADHRGPDQLSIQQISNGAIGMNRLAIVATQEDVTVQSDAQKKLHLIFNGEIVNYIELKKELQIQPKKDGDTAILLPLYNQFGESFVKKLAGMFTIALVDDQKNEVHLFRDPLGIKPLYYYYENGLLIFSSEIKSIYSVLDEKPQIDFSAIHHMLQYRFHSGKTTVFKKIKRVLPGEQITFKQGKEFHKLYWKLRTNKNVSNPKISVEQFRELFKTVVKQNLRGDAKGGYFVSRGLDSSFITSLGLQHTSNYTRPISINFTPNPVIDEKYAQKLEKYLKTKFTWTQISDEDARSGLEELVAFMDEPLENPIHVGTYFMAKKAHELGIKSVLTGDGSDEFFIGYARQACWFSNENDPKVAYPKWLWSITPEDITQLYTEKSKSQITPFLDNFDQPIEPFTNIQQVLCFERLERLAEYHCMRIDRMTMAFGVEAKVPFLDHRIVELTLQLSINDLFGKSGKEWLQKIAEPFLPQEIINREKVHFPSLPDQWISGKGITWIKKILLSKDARILKWFNKSALEDFIYQHEAGTKKYGRQLWAFAVLELWLQQVEQWAE